MLDQESLGQVLREYELSLCSLHIEQPGSSVRTSSLSETLQEDNMLPMNSLIIAGLGETL